MVRASSQGRQPVIETDPWDSTVLISRYNKSSSRRVVCKLCGDVLTGGVTRLKAHYSWIGSKGKESCKFVTEDLWLAFGGERARYITIMPSLHGPISKEALLEKVQAEKAKLATHHHPLVAASSAPQASIPNIPFVSPTPRARNVATSVEDSNVGGDATQGAYKRFVNAVSAAAAAGAPITPARSEALRTSRLTRQVDMVHEMLGGHRESWALYGCTIISDGWKDVRKRHLLNILVSCCTGTTFLRAIDVSGAGIQITGGKGIFSRGIAKDAENQALPVSWWEKFGRLNPALQCLALLNTPQLDRLAFVNANLRVLEKAGGLECVGPISWLPKQVDHRQIVVKAADVSQLQPRTPEDVYDFIREDMMRFSRQTRSTTRRLRGESAVGTSSARPQRAARARRRTRSVAELTSASRRLTPTLSECER
ncbi:hypothetical protein L7F22_057263 [Adiantum nelumboides]|nr:hypothetical protein [Adiantum nelumboides]